MDLVRLTDGSQKFEFRHALAGETSCDQELYISHLGNELKLCQMYELSMPESFSEFQHSIVLVSALKGDELIETNVTDVIEIDNDNVLLDSIDLSTYQYATKVCLDEVCSVSKLIEIDTSNADLPSACKDNI